MNILLIEPDIILAGSYIKSLEADGHQLRVVNTAQAAIDVVDDQAPDLILLELQLVGHGGIEFLYELRSYTEWQKLAVIILSFVPPVEFKQNWRQLQNELNIMEYLYKPHTSLTKLQRAIDNVEVSSTLA